MNSDQKKKIMGLVREYSGSGTESLIAFVAGTDGLLSACQAMLHSLDAEGSADSEWLQQECSQEDVLLQPFVLEVRKIVALFKPSPDVEAPHAILGVSTDAGLDEIKHAYRTLSRRYHPDTALPPYRDNPEMFVAINRAYNALMNEDKAPQNKKAPQGEHWRIKKKRTVSPDQRKKAFTWVSGMLIVLVVISVIASINYQKRAMLAGLQESRGAFIPPAGKASGGTSPEKEKAEEPLVEKPVVDVAATDPPQVTENKAGSEAATEIPPNLQQESTGNEPAITKAASSSPVVTVEESPKAVQRTAGESDVAGLPPHGKQNDIKPATDPIPVHIPAASSVKKRKSEVYEPAPAGLAKVMPEKTPKRTPETGVDLTARADEKVGNKPGKPGAGSTAQNREGGSGIGATVGEKKVDRRQVAVPAAAIAPVRQDPADAMDPDAVFAKARPHSDTRITEAPPEDKSELAVATVGKIVHPPAVTVEITQAAATEENLQVATPPAEEEQSRERDNLQARLDSFFARYIDAYEQRDLFLFARFFERKAEENGKAFSSIMPTYLDLFTTTKKISLRVEERSHRLVDGVVKVDGRFKVFLEYADNRKVTGSGPIHFLLAENGSEMLIRKMDYVFHSDSE